MIIKKGTIVALTLGEYSDYCLHGHVRALQDISTGDVIRRYMEGREGHYGIHLEFIAWMIREGMIEPVSDGVTEWWIGDRYDLLSDD